MPVPDPPDPAASPSAAEVLRRWRDSGGSWRVLVTGPAQVTVALLTCTGEEVERRTWPGDPALTAFLAEPGPPD